MRAAMLAGGLAGAVLLAGCTSLPESGPVRRVAERASDPEVAAPYFQPPGPEKGASPAEVVSDFLTAMQANPLSTSVARRFLSERARESWKPGRSTLIYGSATVRSGGAGVTVRLADPRRLDARGAWLGGVPGGTEVLELSLVQQGGEWRIEDPPDALVVPLPFFDRSFARLSLYFFDQTGRTLLPDPVFVPRGEQTATNLVRGLVAGPGAGIGEVTRSALPQGTTLDLSVEVTESGVAEIPLSREVLSASRRELERMVDQLGWTLRQVPGVQGLRITVDGTPVALPNGRLDASVLAGREYDAAGTGAALVWGLRGGRVVDLGADTPDPVGGPLGRTGYALRSLAVSESPRRVAAVSASGRSVYVAPVDAQEGAAAKVLRVVGDGTDVLRPQYDVFGDLWLVDRTSRGARVLVVRDGRVRALAVPGVTGRDLAAFAVARDGSRMAVAYRGTTAPVLRVVDLLRTDEGLLTGAGSARTFPADASSPRGAVSGTGRYARVYDIGWRDPATLAVLTRPTAETSEVGFVGADGSPVANQLTDPPVFRGAATALVVAPDPDLALRLVAQQRLYTLSEGGAWPLTTSRVVAATYLR